jgi:hypothetical protein
VLDPSSAELSKDLEYVDLRTLKDVKQVLGCPDSVFIGEYPRFRGFSPGHVAPEPSSALTLAKRKK